MKKTCMIISGPTASGKTALAIELAKQYNTQIISADSRQCYKELNIGVAKPLPEQLKEVHHYFIDAFSIHENVDARVFEKYAVDAVNEIFKNHDIAVMVGGTGLYIKAFCEGMDEIPEIPAELENWVKNQYSAYGIQWLKEEIKNQDPLYFAEGEMENPHRMMRALQIKLHTGISIRKFQTSKKINRPFEIKNHIVSLPKNLLHDRINQRVDDMMTEGLLDEVKSLWSYRHLNALQTVGYRELFQYLEGHISLEQAIDDIKKNTRHYAKRQVTWFKKYQNYNLF